MFKLSIDIIKILIRKSTVFVIFRRYTASDRSEKGLYMLMQKIHVRKIHWQVAMSVVHGELVQIFLLRLFFDTK